MKEDEPTSTPAIRSNGYKIMGEPNTALSNSVLNSQISHADRVIADLTIKRGSHLLLGDNAKKESQGTTVTDTSKVLSTSSIGSETQAG